MPKGIYLHKKGRIVSEETRSKLSMSLKGMKRPWVKPFFTKGHKHSEETLRKISETKKGVKPTEQAIISMKKAAKRGKEHPWYGRNMSGERNPMWISDRTKLIIREKRNDSMYQAWRNEIKKRDSFKCKISNEECSGRLEVHHILSWKDYPELRYQINNGITLCHAHHPLKRAEEKRLSPFFQELINLKS